MLRWSKLQKASQPGRASDPYFRWARISLHRGLARHGDRQRMDWRLLVQTDLDQYFVAESALEWEVPEVYKDQLATGKPCFFTASFAPTPERLDWLETQAEALRWELAVPFRDAETHARAHRMGYYGPEREAVEFRVPWPKGLLGGRQPAAPVEPVQTAALIGVIDFGCPFLHQRFAKSAALAGNPFHEVRDAKTRLLAVWDQGSDPSARVLNKADEARWPWRETVTMGYGRQLLRGDIERLRKAVWRKAPVCDEAEVYRVLDTLIAYEDPRRRIWRSTHGAHVLDLAGGSLDPLRSQDDSRLPDPASQADLGFVSLPSLTAGDASGGSLGAQVLDGVQFLWSLCKPKTGKAVINISYGTHAGPHNGSSMIEQALDDAVDKARGRLALVLAAGNAAQAGCHLRREVSAQRSALLRFDLAPGDSTDSFIEIWYTAPTKGAQLELRVRSSDWDWSDWAAPGDRLALRETGHLAPVAWLSHDLRVPNGERKAMVLLALAPTLQAVDDDGPLATPGRWEIELRLCGAPRKKAVTVDAWIERDDIGEFGNGLHTRFVGAEPRDRKDCLSSLAGGTRTFVAQGHRRSDGQRPDYVSGGERPIGALPLISAVCEEDEHRPGLRAAAVRSVDQFVMAGTSVAAPVLARRLFNLMCPNSGSLPKSPSSTAKGATPKQLLRQLRETHDPSLKF